MDEVAFTLLYERTARPLYRYLLRASGSRDIADDLVQESYCRLLAADRQDLDESSVKNYLFRIATNLLRDRWRQIQRTPRTPWHEALEPYTIVERHDDLESCFQRLRPRERLLLWMAYVERATHTEIAESTGLRPNSVRILLFRARRKLANELRRRE